MRSQEPQGPRAESLAQLRLARTSVNARSGKLAMAFVAQLGPGAVHYANALRLADRTSAPPLLTWETASVSTLPAIVLSAALLAAGSATGVIAAWSASPTAGQIIAVLAMAIALLGRDLLEEIGEIQNKKPVVLYAIKQLRPHTVRQNDDELAAS